MFPIEQINSQPNSISTIKLVRDNKTNKYLKFKEVLNLSIKNSFKIEDYNNLGLTVINNDQDLILDVLKEYLLKKENKSIRWAKEDLENEKAKSSDNGEFKIKTEDTKDQSSSVRKKGKKTKLYHIN